MHKLKQIFITTTIVLTLSACGDQRILEKLGFTQTTSYDLLTENEEKTKNKLMISISMPKLSPEGGTTQRELLTAIASTSKEGRIKLSTQTELTLVSGQMRNALFGLPLSKQGLWEHIDTLVRDPSISPGVKVTVVDGNAHDLLAKDYPSHPRTGQYIDHLLEKEALVNTIPTVTLFEFTRDYFDDGVDPVAPIIKQSGKNIFLDGIALFRKDRYVTKVKPEQALIFAILHGNFKQGELSINLEESGRDNEHVMFSSLISQRKIKASPNLRQNHIIIDIDIKIKGSVLEYIGDLHLDNDKDRKEIENLISKYITKETQKMIAKMQKNNVDSIGLGKYVRSKLTYKEWNNLNWHDIYPDVQVHCHAKVVIKDYGKFEK